MSIKKKLSVLLCCTLADFHLPGVSIRPAMMLPWTLNHGTAGTQPTPIFTNELQRY
eukprot:COSAG01_NODE_62919_length_282_cov_0.846995_1_plen_55_part_10